MSIKYSLSLSFNILYTMNNLTFDKILFTEYTSGNATFENMQKNGFASKGAHFQERADYVSHSFSKFEKQEDNAKKSFSGCRTIKIWWNKI